MHSTGSMSARRTSIVRPALSGIALASDGKSSGSTDTRWFGAMSANSSSQNAVIAVSTRPLSGMGSAITTSKADMRSEATNSNCPSPAS